MHNSKQRLRPRCPVVCIKVHCCNWMCELALKIVMKNTVENVIESQKKCVTVPGLQKPQQSQTGAVKIVENQLSKSENNEKEMTKCLVGKFLPFAVFFTAFVSVMTLLFVYMDTIIMEYNEFKLNMTRSYVFNISQDNPELVTYIRQVHLLPAQQYFEYKRHEVGHHFNPKFDPKPSAKILFVAKYFLNKRLGVFIETNAYHLNKASDTEYLEKNLSWTGLLIESNPSDFLHLQSYSRFRSTVIHACLSTSMYPKDVMYREQSEISEDVEINQLNSGKMGYFNGREKCFPLYSLMLAGDFVTVDYLSLHLDQSALSILKTLPFNSENPLFKISMIDVYLHTEQLITLSSIQSFLAVHDYKLLKQFESNYLFVYSK